MREKPKLTVQGGRYVIDQGKKKIEESEANKTAQQQSLFVPTCQIIIETNTEKNN
jgi:hypothetical protein